VKSRRPTHPGLTALYGMDGALYGIGPLVAFCTVLLIIAEPLRNTGTYTLGDVIYYRMKRPPALAAAVLGTIVVNLAYMVPQMAGGGVLLKLLLGLPYDVSVMLLGLGMIIYVAAGGILATSWVQIVKAVLLLSAGAIVLLMGCGRSGSIRLFSSAPTRRGTGRVSCFRAIS
jgi:cation/acetate symporter